MLGAVARAVVGALKRDTWSELLWVDDHVPDPDLLDGVFTGVLLV